MNLRYSKIFINLFFLLQFTVALPAAAQASALNEESSVELPYGFINGKTVILRNSSLASPQVIEAGSQISIDSKFLLRHLGSENPSQEQIQKLLLNPEEITKARIVTQRFIGVNDGKVKHDYFFPVTVKTKSGQIKSGSMAIHAYNRTGMIELQRTDGTDPSRFQSPEITAKMKELIAENKSKTEAQTCTDCAENKNTPSKEILDITRVLDAEAQASTNKLWKQYQDFAKAFTEKNSTITKARAGYYKRLFIQSLIEKFGEKDSGVILAALTGFGEAPHRNSNETQIAEIAAVVKVIENRANNKFRSKSRALKDIGVSENADARLSAILADWQFSTWNDKDNNLRRILKFNPDTADKMTKRKMALSFEAQRMMQTGKVEFLGKMNDSNLQHYHANYVNPNWSKTNKKVGSPTIKVDGIEVDLGKQKGARHVFYTGLS